MDERKDKTTDPAPPPTREQIFDDLMERVASLHSIQGEMMELVGRLVVKNGIMSEAILDIQSSLGALWADGTLTREQIQPFGVRLGEMNGRLDRIEKRIRDSQVPEAP